MACCQFPSLREIKFEGIFGERKMFSCWQTMVSNILLQNHFVFSVAHTPRSANTLHLVGAHSKQNLWYGGLKRYNKAVNINCNHQQLRRKLLPQKQRKQKFTQILSHISTSRHISILVRDVLNSTRKKMSVQSEKNVAEAALLGV